MQKLLEIALLDMRLFLSSAGNLVSITILPIILTLVLGGAGSSDGSPPRIRIDVLDMDTSAQAETLINTLSEFNSSLLICPAEQTEDNPCNLSEDETLTLESAQVRLENDTTSALIVIPATYSEDIQNFEAVAIDYYADSGITGTDPVLTALQSALEQINGAAVASQMGLAYVETLSEAFEGVPVFSSDEQQSAYSAEVYENAQALLADAPVQVQYELSRDGVQDSSDTLPGGFGQSVPGMATMFALFTVLGGTSLLLQERKQWTLQRMITMPVSRAQLLGGKILSRFSLGMLQFMIILAIGLLVGLDFGDNPILILPIMLSYTLCVTALAFAIAPLIRSDGQASSITLLLSMSMAALGGAWWSLSLPFIPDFMRSIGYLTPVAWAMQGFNDLIFYGGGLNEILVPCAVLLVASAILFGIGIRLFRYD